MTVRVSDNCETHRKNFPARKPNLYNLRYEDEKDQVGDDEGLFEMVFPPRYGIAYGTPPTSLADMPQCGESKYLWVVASATVPAALERPRSGRSFKRGTLTHTNLTGNNEAHTGGELWFKDSGTVFINGGSSRYTPRTPEELLSVGRALKDSGYKVASLGWDEGTNQPLRVQTEKLTWV